MAQKLLDRAKVGTGPEEVGREGVTQCVWGDVPDDRGLAEPAIEDPTDATIGQAPSPQVEEHGLRVATAAPEIPGRLEP